MPKLSEDEEGLIDRFLRATANALKDRRIEVEDTRADVAEAISLIASGQEWQPYVMAVIAEREADPDDEF